MAVPSNRTVRYRTHRPAVAAGLWRVPAHRPGCPRDAGDHILCVWFGAGAFLHSNYCPVSFGSHGQGDNEASLPVRQPDAARWDECKTGHRLPAGPAQSAALDAGVPHDVLLALPEVAARPLACLLVNSTPVDARGVLTFPAFLALADVLGPRVESSAKWDGTGIGRKGRNGPGRAARPTPSPFFARSPLPRVSPERA